MNKTNFESLDLKKLTYGIKRTKNCKLHFAFTIQLTMSTLACDDCHTKLTGMFKTIPVEGNSKMKKKQFCEDCWEQTCEFECRDVSVCIYKYCKQCTKQMGLCDSCHTNTNDSINKEHCVECFGVCSDCGEGFGDNDSLYSKDRLCPSCLEIRYDAKN